MQGFYSKHLKRLLLVLVLLVGVVSLVQAQENVLVPGATVTGTLDATNRALVYTFSGTEGQTVNFVLTGETGLQLALLVTDSAGQTLLQFADDQPSGPDTTDELSLPATGIYYVTIFVLPESEVTEGTFQLAFVTEGSAPIEGAVDGTTPVPANTDAVFVQPTQIITTDGLDVTLTWDTVADMNLQVRDPNGETLYWDSTTTSNGGSFGFDVNGLCEVVTADEPTETASWPAGGLPTGSYEILVFYRQSCDDSSSPVSFRIGVNFNGQELTPITGSLTPPFANQESVFITSFDVATDGTVSSGAAGVYSPDTLPPGINDLRNSAVPIQLETPVNGSIVNEQPFQSYSFAGQEGEFVTATMTRTAGNLDTQLILLDPNGARIDFNDDVAFGITDSAIRDRLLPLTGTYTLIATRYGKEIGGTEGNYILSIVTGSSAAVPQAVLDLALPQGSIEISLVWNTPADLQLLVSDPSRASVYDDIPTIASGGALVASGNVGCRIPTSATPVSYTYWPDGLARAGTYEIEVWYQNDCQQNAPVQFTLTVEVNGRVVFNASANPLPNDRYVTHFTLGTDGTVEAGPGGIVGGVEQVAYQDVSASPIIPGQPVTGEITAGDSFDVYTFDATAGDVVTIGMTQVSGTLDTRLLLVGPNGIQVAENDDVVLGEDTNSVISQLELPDDGTYTVIATRYGLAFGGTVGQYRLLVSPQ
jgi:hypothetical protein